MNNESVKNNSLIQKLSKGFSKLSRPEREQRLIQMGVLNVEDIAILNHESALSSSPPQISLLKTQWDLSLSL